MLKNTTESKGLQEKTINFHLFSATTKRLTLKVPEKKQLYIWTLCVLCGAYLRLWHVKS